MSDEIRKRPNQSRPEESARGASPEPTLPADIGQTLRAAGLDPSDPNFIRVLAISLKFFSGQHALPPAEHVAPWEELYPGISAKIVQWTEEQGAHRRALEKERTNRAEERMDRSQRNALIVAIVGLILAAIVGVTGSAFAAAAIALFAVGGPATTLALAARSKQPRS